VLGELIMLDDIEFHRRIDGDFLRFPEVAGLVFGKLFEARKECRMDSYTEKENLPTARPLKLKRQRKGPS